MTAIQTVLETVPGSVATPTPTPTTFDEDSVTPGWLGFVVTAVLVAAVVLLILDMVRRMRRVRYRAEARERIAAELAADATPDEVSGARDADAGDAAR